MYSHFYVLQTLQSIALLYTILKQSPSPGVAAASKAIVVCPSSLVGNWRAEFKRWLGTQRIEPICVDKEGVEAGRQVRIISRAPALGVVTICIVSLRTRTQHTHFLSLPLCRVLLYCRCAISW